MRRSQKRKKLLNLTVFFALLGSARVKAARRLLVKLTPDVAAQGHVSERGVGLLRFGNPVKDNRRMESARKGI